MLTNRSRGPLALALVCLMALAAPVAASGHGKKRGHGPKTLAFELAPVPHDPAVDNGSFVTGAGDVHRYGRWVLVRIVATGLDALPHAMHIHGKDTDEVASCPGEDRRDDLVDDGLIEVLEGVPDYGGIQVSLTTSGDTSPASALALDRFPVASPIGVLVYERWIKLSKDLSSHLDDSHVVVHGEDLDDDGAYGGRVTDLGAPLEAELPVACGEITTVASRGHRARGKRHRR